MSNYNETIDFLSKKIPFKPLCAIIRGSGIAQFAETIPDRIEIPYEQIPGFVRSTAPGHDGTLIASYLNETPVLTFRGRFHLYEGYSAEQTVYPVRIARLLGAKYLFVTNAAGSLNPNMLPGQIVRISDHINMTGANPLIGKNTLDEPIMIDGVLCHELGERFVSQHEPYDRQLAVWADEIARERNISLMSGVYCGLLGPTYETKAECLMLRGWGADLVGMSTVLEVITALHCGLKVFGVSIVTNLSNIYHSEAHTHNEIMTNAKNASKNLFTLITSLIDKINIINM